jgi:hypothetical protein
MPITAFVSATSTMLRMVPLPRRKRRGRNHTPIRSFVRHALPALAFAIGAEAAFAAPISNPVAEFTGLDKITGRTINFDVLIDETVQFGALQVTPRVCHIRPPTEPAQTTAFVEIDEITLSSQIQRLFTGWMFAASPGLHAVEHPVYDVWLTDCKVQMGAEPEAPLPETAPGAEPELPAPEDAVPED